VQNAAAVDGAITYKCFQSDTGDNFFGCFVAVLATCGDHTGRDFVVQLPAQGFLLVFCSNQSREMHCF